jgi:acetate kinase
MPQRVLRRPCVCVVSDSGVVGCGKACFAGRSGAPEGPVPKPRKSWAGAIEPRTTSKSPRILAINAGSSSLKFALFEGAEHVLHGGIAAIGVPGSTFNVDGSDPTANVSRPVSVSDHQDAVDVLMSAIAAKLTDNPLDGVGHRVVHGGAAYSAPQKVDPDMIAALRGFNAFDPEHLPAEISLLEAFQRLLPDTPQVACFDTAFHHDLPRVARLLPIPRCYEAEGIRRYGFHGLSCTFLMAELARLDGAKAASGRVVLAHLGSGASLTAVRDGKSVDTSMSFTPASGIPMSSRAGDLDPGLMTYLALTENMAPTQFGEMANFRSGLLGISETSGDMADLLGREAEDVRAAEAVAIFCYQVRKWIGAFAAALGGLDALVFAGGIGENAPVVRARICQDLGFLGIGLDHARNDASAPIISTDASRVRVRVIHTDEEVVIARSVAKVLGLAVSA